ncbi:tRNA (adenosine(37)-N6)-threonylcarbamoyltransferase complex dimerization subunit type 1 TsaB [Corynebacterium timonense]|uniref:tRNA threonylcarbamoyl adenosine modification protein YeaZ n=1 Tax=Corynebacterium timonense TaxID=441500 RepID=A0A1H1SHV8_9CORY|nr:tRNA (adenosine(37)-N6)-threonylcarbamoyltransferase complex dimerization subunit type 1 TsaB [Corynebacterium timonense]SDS47453.1 tRNA threonylcarbamoyl adenosine modification protein YeaZ [Corynebacterium timonense]
MIVLALDTATADLIVGVVDTDSGRALAETVRRTRAHNEELIPAASRALESAGLGFPDLGAIVVGCGPGPFTGLRVGMATAQALGQALGIAVHGVVTHDAVAAELGGQGSALVVSDARRREVYWARYHDGVRVDGPGVCAPADLPVPEDVDVVSVPEHLAEEVRVPARRVTYAAPRAAALVAVADLAAEPGPLVPYYLRRPDAVPPAAAPKSPAIPDVDLGEGPR